jgi:hypothetical protein
MDRHDDEHHGDPTVAGDLVPPAATRRRQVTGVIDARRSKYRT